MKMRFVFINYQLYVTNDKRNVKEITFLYFSFFVYSIKSLFQYFCEDILQYVSTNITNPLTGVLFCIIYGSTCYNCLII
jgi:hypothetical protein